MINVLIVDDHLIIAKGIKVMLSRDSDINVVDCVLNGQEAIDYLSQSNQIDVVLMDINMPEMNGIKATEIITKKFKNVNVLALTMYSQEDYIVAMLKAGAIGYLTKECGTNELISAIKAVSKSQKYYSNEVSVIMIKSLMNEESSGSRELSKRELEILSFIAGGYSNFEISQTLEISQNTVDVHRRNILDKLELKNTAGLVKYAFENDLKIKNEPI